MRSNFLLIGTALASTAMATSYNCARGLDADYSEIEERDAFSSEEEAAHFLRDIDDDELNALYVRGRARPGAGKPMQNNIKTLIARPRKTRRGIFKDIFNAQKKKPSLPAKPSRAKPDSRMKKLFGDPLIKNLARKKNRRGIFNDLANAKKKKPSLPAKPSRAKPNRSITHLADKLGLNDLARKKNRRSISRNIGGKKQRFRGPGAAAARRQRQFLNTKLLAGTPKKIPRRG